jgi:cytochrome c6
MSRHLNALLGHPWVAGASLFIFLLSGGALMAQSATPDSGATIFKSKCVLCHGADGSGNTPLGKQLQAANLRSKDVQKLSDSALHKVVHDGQANMPSFADQLNRPGIEAVVRYVRALAKPAKK